MDPKQKEGQDNPVAGGIYSSDASASASSGSGLFSFRTDNTPRTNRNQRHRDPAAPNPVPRMADRTFSVRTIIIVVAVVAIVGIIALVAIVGANKSSQQGDSQPAVAPSDSTSTFQEYLYYFAYGARDDKNASFSLNDMISDYSKYLSDIFIEKKIAENDPEKNREYFSSLNELYSRFYNPYLEYLEAKIGTLDGEDPDENKEDENTEDEENEDDEEESSIVYADDEDGEEIMVPTNNNTISDEAMSEIQELESQIDKLGYLRTYYYDYATLIVLTDQQILKYYIANGEDDTKTYINRTIRTDSENALFEQYVSIKNSQALATVDFISSAETFGCNITEDDIKDCNKQDVPGYDEYAAATLSNNLAASSLSGKLHSLAISALKFFYDDFIGGGTNED